MEWTEERIDVDKHFRAIGDFVCGADDPLNVFLSDKAIDYDDDRLGSTYVLIHDEQILAYYTLKANGVQVKREIEGFTEYDALPMIEIARIAVSHEIQGNGFGKLLFHNYIIPKVKTVAEIVAIKGIMVFVERHNESGIAFYQSVGFQKAGDEVQKAIGETFNEECDLYMVNLEDL